MSQRITISFPDIRKFTYSTTNKLENELETGELGKISGLLLAFFVLGRAWPTNTRHTKAKPWALGRKREETQAGSRLLGRELLGQNVRKLETKGEEDGGWREDEERVA